MQRIKALTAAAEQHVVLQSEMEREKEQLEHDLAVARAELSNLRTAKDLQHHRASESLISSDASDVSRQLFAVTKQRDDAISRANALESKLLLSSSHSSQPSVRSPPSKYASEYEEERQKAQQTIADLTRQLKQANKTIEAFTATGQSSEAQHKHAAQRAEDTALLEKQLMLLQRENNDLRKQRQTAGVQGNTSLLEQALEDALNQRDAAIRKLRQAQGSKGAAHDSVKMIKQLQLAHSALATLGTENTTLRRELMLERELTFHNLKDPHAKQDHLQTSEVEDVQLLRGAVNELERMLHIKEAQVQELQQLQHNPIRDRKLMLALMLAKQKESDAYQAALFAVIEAVQQLMSQPETSLQLRRTAESALNKADEIAALQLPLGWEARVSPEGIVYYIDHNRKQSTWIHPFFGSDPASTAESSFPAPSFDAPYVTYNSSQFGSSGASQSLGNSHRDLIASIRAIQAKTLVK